MVQRLCQWLLYRVWGWKKRVTEEHPDKYIICLAPHTSNWDLLLGQLYARAEGIRSKFLMKREWFFWPLGPIFKSMGGIPVWRDKHSSLTDNLAAHIRGEERCVMCVTPEGTRSLNPEWKKGFYFIAMKAGIPILLYGADYQKREIVCTKTMVPTGDVDADMREIKLYYKDFRGKHPEKFTIGEI